MAAAEQNQQWTATTTYSQIVEKKNTLDFYGFIRI